MKNTHIIGLGAIAAICLFVCAEEQQMKPVETSFCQATVPIAGKEIAYRALQYANEGRWDLAVREFQRAVDQGHIPSNISLCICYSMGMGVEKNLDKSLLYLEKAVSQNDPMALYIMASLKSPEGSLIYEKTQAMGLNMKLFEHLPVKKDEKSAMDLLKQSADLYNSLAIYTLFLIYDLKDQEKCMVYFDQYYLIEQLEKSMPKRQLEYLPVLAIEYNRETR